MNDNYSQYDITDFDPYLQPGSDCLINLLGLTDTATLNVAEEEFSSPAAAAISVSGIPLTFDFNHLKAIHHWLFKDVYPFAGEVRQVEISKSDKLFLPYSQISEQAEECFLALQSENYLHGLSLKEFASRAGFYLGWINMIHTFREGNGRTQRAIISQLAQTQGYAFKWDAISPQAMAQACFEARTSDRSARQLSRLLEINIYSD